ncbi:MAG: hypothetical protein ACRDTO_18255 [Mycobacterium sp.]
MTTPSTPWGDERGQLSHRVQMRYHSLGRRQARRLSRRFAGVGVEAPPQRLQQMLAGVPAAAAEVTAVDFALIATQLEHDERVAKFKRLKRRGTRLLIQVGLALVTLHFLLCMAYALFIFASPL